MTETSWMTLEEASRAFGVHYDQLWDYILGRVPGARLPVYRLTGGTEIRIREEDLLALLKPVVDPAELEELRKVVPRPKMPGRLL
jgi:hypothetical protein